MIEQLHRIKRVRPSAKMDQGSSVGDQSAALRMHHPEHGEESSGVAGTRTKRRKNSLHALAGPDGISGSKKKPNPWKINRMRLSQRKAAETSGIK